jgi:hypothetical protein
LQGHDFGKDLGCRAQQLSAGCRCSTPWFISVVPGYFNYHAVPGNLGSLGMLRERVLSLWWHTLCRRSQKAHAQDAHAQTARAGFRNRGCSILTLQFASPPCICDKNRMRYPALVRVRAGVLGNRYPDRDSTTDRQRLHELSRGALGASRPDVEQERRLRCLAEVEAVRHIVGCGVTAGESLEAEARLQECQER